MPNPYSPIDESSFTDTASFDPEEMLNPRRMSNTPGQSSDIPTQDKSREPYTEPSTTDSATASTANDSEPTASADIPADTAGDQSTATRRPRKFTALNAVIDSISNMRTFKFLGIIIFFFAAYSFVVCCSYFFTIGSDQSAILNGELDLEMYENAGRKFGAMLAHTLIYDWVGIGAFILIFYFGACGLSMLGVYRPGFWGMTMRCLLTTVALSVIMGLVTYEIASPVYWGGLHGQLLNERLIAYSGFWGALTISLILGSMVIMLYLNELRNGWHSLNHSLDGYRDKQASRRARRDAKRAEAEARAQALRVEAATNAEVRRLTIENDRLKAEARAREQVKTTPSTSPSVKVAEPAAVVAPKPSAIPVTESEPVSPEAPSSTTPAEIPSAETDTTADTVNDSDTADAPLFAKGLGSLFSTPAKKATATDVHGSDSSLNASDDDTSDDDSQDIEDPQENIGEEEITPLFPGAKPATRDPQAIDPRDRPLYDPRADLSRFEFPSLDLLNNVESRMSVDATEMDENNARITKTLSDYGIAISHIKATVGPTVTLYEIIPAEGVRISKIKNLEDDIALSLAALGIRIIAPIPGRGTIGIEVPNKDPQTVSMRSVLESEKFQNTHMELPMAIGRTVSNDVYMADLTKMPHLLVAGATGMGKSVGLNAIIASLLYKKHPAELKFVMIDPKKVEFSLYAKLERHYLAKLPDEEDAIITDPSKVVATLNSLCVEMENRYALLKDAQMRNVKEYNERFVRHALNPERGHRYLPYIVVIVDEFADLIITAGKEVETPIARIAQMARAVGIHMILATQRPSTNVITGVIKANFPGRIAFRVFQMVDSRTIIDRPGANQLIGRGDMLFSNNGKIDRVQCAFIDTPEVTAVCDFIDQQIGYDHAYDLPEYTPEGGDTASVASLGDRDPLFDECARLVVSTDTASTSSLQRRYSIGYNRAGKIMDQMEAAGIVGPSQGGKPRQVLVDIITLERILENK
ncbi:MAG: DNA translocase FtsK 4TM domain-containing protein [Paenibacillus sp.]|nr:DNA translocase FtsK 4TM domain-containing protein [Paenibacillus sp.]